MVAKKVAGTRANLTTSQRARAGRIHPGETILDFFSIGVDRANCLHETKSVNLCGTRLQLKHL